MTAEQAAAPLPIGGGDRVELIDILRGFALLGILLVNFTGTPGSWLPRFDSAVASGVAWLAEKSFYPLFSVLFGLGFAAQLLRAGQNRAGAVHPYLRRLLVLLIIGTIHKVLIWSGDILVTYALLGFMLIPLSRLAPRALLAVILLLLAVVVAGDRIEGWLSTPEQLEARHLVRGAINEDRWIARWRTWDLEGAGDFAERVAGRWTRYGQAVVEMLSLKRLLGNDILLMFTVGLYLGRRRLIQEAPSHRQGYVVLLVVAVMVTVGGALYQVTGRTWGREADSLMLRAANWGVTAGYIAGIVLLVTGGWSRWFRTLAPAGQMGLTNYLAQSVVMTGLFAPYALNLPDPHTTGRLVVCLGFFFLFQLPVSRWWLARYRFGPAEWLWRSLTYGVRQPIRKGPVVVATA